MLKKILIGALASACFLTPPAWATVKTQVLELDVKLSTQKITQIHLSGLVRNHHELTVRDVNVRVKLFKPDNTLIRSFYLAPYAQIKPGVTLYYQADQTLHQYDPAYVKAVADVAYKSITYLQITDWIMAKNWNELMLWNIPVTQGMKDNEGERINQALAYLTRIDSTNKLYSESRRKWNLIQFNYAKRLILARDLHEAMLRLANVESQSQYYAEAQELIKKHRLETIYHRALLKAQDGNLRGAYRQMQYISEDSSYASQAKSHQVMWLETLKAKRVWMGTIQAPKSLSQDQKQVWLRRKHGPEGHTTSQSKNGQRLITWWYLDYSHYTFNKQGQLVNSKVY